jgi:hypothetical protein
MTHGREKSDPAIVAGKSTNKDTQLSAESMEPRAGAKGNAIERGMRRTPRRESMSHGLDRVRQAAKEQKGERFTALLHHIDVELLGAAYGWLRKEASAGCGWGDLGGIRRRTGVQARGPARPYPPGCLSSATVTAGVYSEAGRTRAPTGHIDVAGIMHLMQRAFVVMDVDVLNWRPSPKELVRFVVNRYCV